MRFDWLFEFRLAKVKESIINTFVEGVEDEGFIKSNQKKEYDEVKREKLHMISLFIFSFSE